MSLTNMTPQEFATAVRAAAAARPESTETGIRIVVLQRGWVVIGRYTRRGQNCTLTNGFVIRRWGTTNGLGQLAMSGPTNNTTLEPTPDMRFHQLTEVMNISCEEGEWLGRLRH